MRRLFAAMIAAGTLAVAPAAAPAATTTSLSACTQAKTRGRAVHRARAVLQRSARAMRDYRRYGLSCTKRDRNGRYHLV